MENIEYQCDNVVEKSNFYYQGVPVGAVMAFAMPFAPEGWLVCDGEMYPKDLFPFLSRAIGSIYNQPDTPEGFFCVPDLQGMFVRGWDNDGDVDSERGFGSFQKDAIQGHSHFFDISNIKIDINEAGSHNHPLWCSQWETVTTGLNKYKRMADPSTEQGYRDTNLSPLAGKHTHKGVLTAVNNPIKDALATKYGIPRIDIETRPQNIALLYCIKAENLPSPDILAETGYSTIIEKVKKELMGSVLSLSRTLPIVKIGGNEYLINIEKIKQSHFYTRPSTRQDLVFTAAQCFYDICVYNARVGHRFEGFDEYGLDLLVSWIIDKGFLEQKDKLLIIDEVKKFIMNLSSNITPKE